MKKNGLTIGVLLLTLVQISFAQSQKTLIDFFEPMPIQEPLVSEGIWGASNVLPRDVANGLEDPKMENWCYWDGSIVKDDEGIYHMYFVINLSSILK